jgi:glutathione S-transferase
MKLIGLFDSPFVRRVVVSMRLQGFAFEHGALSVYRNQDESRAINPLVKVPTLVLDNGEILIDSSAILDYLDGIAPEGKRLMPASGEARRKVQQQCAVALVGMEKVFAVMHDTQLRPAELRWPLWIERCTQQMHGAFTMLEAMPVSPVLSSASLSAFLTQADVTTAVAIRCAQFFLPAEFSAGRYPRLEQLSAHCEALPAFADTPLE